MARITIKRIAQLANVSIGTVDRVLNNRGSVNAETKKRIESICQEYGYKSNSIGKAMAMQRSENKIAVIVKRQGLNTYNDLIHQGLDLIASEIQDYNITFEKYHLEYNTEEEFLGILDALSQESLSGIIVRMINSPQACDKLNAISQAQDIPVITFTTDMDAVNKLCFVGQNHYKQGRLAGNMISMIAKEPLRILVVVSSAGPSSRYLKLDGFYDYMHAHNHAYTLAGVVEIAHAPGIDQLSSTLDESVNAIYLHTEDNVGCLNIIRKTLQFPGIVFTYGDQQTLKPYILDKSLDFAIYEDPFQQGYLAGKVLFDYLTTKALPSQSSLVLEGSIAIDENC